MSIRETFLQQSDELLDKLKARIDELNSEIIAVRARRLDAWTDGDLSENSAYHEAENSEEGLQAELASIAKQIAELGISQVSDYKHSGFISAGSVVTLMYESGRKRTIMLVSDQLAELDYDRIAIGSPIGQALEGKQAGDSVVVVMPQKTSVYKILEVD